MHSTKRAPLAACAAALALLWFSACAGEQETFQPPAGLAQAIFDPSATPPKLPVPTDLARDPARGLLSVPVANAIARPDLAAQAAFDRYLNTLDGYPTSASATARFSGKVARSPLLGAADPAGKLPGRALGAALLVLELPAGGAPVTVKDARGTLTAGAGQSVLAITRPGGWKRGTRYALFVRGGKAGARDDQGRPVVRSALFELAASDAPLCAWDAAKKRCTFNYAALVRTVAAKKVRGDPLNQGLTTEEVERKVEEETLAQATRFEGLRRAIDPLLRAAEKAGLPRREVILAWSFTTVGMAEAVFDPAAGKIPQPANDLLLDPKSGKVNIPARAGASAVEAVVRPGLNKLDGFASQGTNLVALSGDIDPARLTGASIVAVDTATLQPVAMTYEWIAKDRTIAVTPVSPLLEKRRYAVFMLSNLERDAKTGAFSRTRRAAAGLADPKGERVVPSPATALMRSRYPLVRDARCLTAGRCVSTVSTLPSASAGTLERIRRAMAPLFAGLELLTDPKTGAQRYRREDVVLAWTQRVMTLTRPATEIRAATYRALAARDKGKPRLSGKLVTSGMPAGVTPSLFRGFVQGSLESWWVLGKDGELLADMAKGRPEKVPFVLYVPAGTPPAAGWPVVVMQHGLGGGARDVSQLADLMAKNGFALMGIDAPYHGERSFCTKASDCVATGGGAPACDTTTGRCKGGDFKRRTSGVPVASGGSKFLNPLQPFTIRDNLRQYVADGSALMRALFLGAEAGIDASGVAGGPVSLDESRVHFVGVSLGAMLGVTLGAVEPLPKRMVFNVGGAPLAEIYRTTRNKGFQALVDPILKILNTERGRAPARNLFSTFQWILEPADPGNFARHVATSPLPDLVKSRDPKKPVLLDLSRRQVMVQVAGDDGTIPTVLQQRLARLLGVSTADTTYAKQDHGFLTRAAPDANATKAAQAQLVAFFKTGKICKPDLARGTCGN